MKVLALFDEHTKLKELCIAITERDKELEQQIKFLKKQVDNLIDQKNKDNLALWKDIANYLKTIEKLPQDFDVTNNNNNKRLCFGLEENMLFIEDASPRKKPTFKAIQLPQELIQSIMEQVGQQDE